MALPQALKGDQLLAELKTKEADTDLSARGRLAANTAATAVRAKKVDFIIISTRIKGL
jgi:hypothetical protein